MLVQNVVNTANTRSDIAAVGEILQLKNKAQGDGDLFMIGRVYYGKLYILLRSINNLYAQGVTSNGIYLGLNEYAWNEVGITFCVDDLNGVGLSDPNVLYDKTYWVADYFKWEITPGYNDNSPGNTAIQFGIYDKNGIPRVINNPATNTNYIYPILKFGISLRNWNFCTFGCDSRSDVNQQWFFQPIFFVQEGDNSVVSNAFTFINDNIAYPGNSNQNGGAKYYGFFQTNSPPGITYDIDDTTKLWAGVEYDTNVLATAYTVRNGGGTTNTDVNHTTYFAREMFYYASSKLNNQNISSSNVYNGLPTQWLFKNTFKNSNNDNVTFQLYGYYSSHPCYQGKCNFPTDDAGNTYAGFKFMMLPVNTFNKDGKSCNNQGLFNPIYHYCSTAYYKGLSDFNSYTKQPYYQNFCNNYITGYSSSNDCILNKSSFPYYYPRFCFSENFGKGNIINEDCGGNYQEPPVYTNGSCKSIIGISLIDLFGNPFGDQNDNYNAIVYNNDTGNQSKCCIRTPDSTSNPQLVNSSSQCLGINICCTKDQDPLTCNGTNGPGGDVNGYNKCSWTDPNGNIICDNTLPQGTICTPMCTPSYTQSGCEIITCDNFDTSTPPAGCVNICTSSVTTNCNYQNNDGNYICDSNNYPPGCINACTGSNDKPNCVIVDCNDYTNNGILPPGCLQSCTGNENPDKDPCYYYINGTWICNGDPPYPPGCKDLCTGDGNDNSNCIIVNCADNNIEGCINQCNQTHSPPDCAYYDSIDSKWICNADAENLPGCINICANENDNSNSCKRITCTGNIYTDSPDCWTQNEGTVTCTGGTNDSSDCVWQTSSHQNICKSINNPSNCVYLCDSSGNPPSWSIINSKPACVNQICDINNNPPGCNKAYVPPDEKDDGNSGSGNSILMWLLIIFGILVFLALVGFLIYYFFIKKKDKSDFDDLIEENKEENKDEADTDKEETDDK